MGLFLVIGGTDAFCLLSTGCDADRLHIPADAGRQFKLHSQYGPSGYAFWTWRELIHTINNIIFVLWMPVHEKDTMDFAYPAHLQFAIHKYCTIEEFKECFTGFVLLPLISAGVSLMTQWDHKKAVQCKILLKHQ